jgi:hypothetical protein
MDRRTQIGHPQPCRVSTVRSAQRADHALRWAASWASGPSTGTPRCRPLYRSPRCRRACRAAATVSRHASKPSLTIAVGSFSPLVVIV